MTGRLAYGFERAADFVWTASYMDFSTGRWVRTTSTNLIFLPYYRLLGEGKRLLGVRVVITIVDY